jgi:hypothetical protein
MMTRDELTANQNQITAIEYAIEHCRYNDATELRTLLNRLEDAKAKFEAHKAAYKAYMDSEIYGW